MTDMVERVSCKVICELPESKSPWEKKEINGVVVLVNPDHEPLIYKDGKVEKLECYDVSAFVGKRV